MKYFTIFFMLLSFNLIAAPVDKSGCQDDFQEDLFNYMHYKMREINTTLVNYELEGAEHHVNFDYHVGFISGQYLAYKNIKDRFSHPENTNPSTN